MYIGGLSFIDKIETEERKTIYDSCCFLEPEVHNCSSRAKSNQVGLVCQFNFNLLVQIVLNYHSLDTKRHKRGKIN